MNNNDLIKEIIISQKDFDNLPRDEDGFCIYKENLDIPNLNLEHLPEKLKIEGYLMCYNNKLKKLPEYLIVDGFLDVCENQLTGFPETMVVKSNILCYKNNLTKEIKSSIYGKISMGKEQQERYNICVKRQRILNKL